MPPLALEKALGRLPLDPDFAEIAVLVAVLLLRCDFDAALALAVRPVAALVDEESLQGGDQQCAKPSLAGVGLREGVQTQQFGHEVLQCILGIMMVESAVADEAIERVMVLCADILQRPLDRGIVLAPKPGYDRPLRRGKRAMGADRLHP